MTTKKKLIAIGAAASILTALFVWNPGGNLGSLASRMLNDISNPTVDHQIIPRLPNNVFGRTNADEYYHPRGVAVYGDKLFVTDWYRHRVKVVNKNTGEVIKIIGKNGSANGEFKSPMNIVIDEKNKFFYVTDLNNDRVQKFNLETYAFVAKLGTTGSGPGNFVNPIGIAIDVANNRLYVSDNYCRVQRFELSTLEYRDSWGRVDSRGNTVCGSGTDQFTRNNGYGPESIVVDSSGDVYVADTWNNRIQKFDYKGAYIATIANYGTNPRTTKNVWVPMGLFIDKGGFLYVADTYDHRIQKFDLQATGNPLVRVYGKNGNDNNEFQYPRGIFVDDNTDIYVADTNSHRIKIFQQHIIIPTAPTNLVATPNVTEMELTWTAATPRTGGTALLDYVVEYRKTTDTDWTTFSDGIGTRTSALITGLTANTEYKFRVYARNTARENGEKSDVITIKTLNTVAPKAPTSLVARVANRQINLSWTASDRNGGSAIKDYIVEFRPSNGGQWQVFNDGVRTATTADVTGLTNGTRYDFRVKAENSTGVGIMSPYSTVVSRTPTADDRCNNIAGTQETVPQNLKQNSQGDCVCVNEGTLESSANPAICTLRCAARLEPVKPKFKVVYDEGYPKLYANADDTVGTPITARRLIISDDTDGTLWDTNTLIPLFRANTQPFYDGALIQDPQRLSLARNGNELKVLWYGNRTDEKIERVKGKIILDDGSPGVKWTSIVELNSFDDADNVKILENNDKVIKFDMAVNSGNDSFVARYDLGSRADACVEQPLIIFDKNATDAIGSLADQVLPVGTATALRDNTSAITRPGYTFAGWNTAADGGGDQYANKAQYTMNVASNVTLFAQWTQNQTYPRTLSFDANGGTGTMAPVSCNAVAQNSQCEVVVPANGFTRTGYTFSHWTINGIRDDEEYASGKTLTMAQNYTMVANWTLIADTTAPSVTAFAIQPTATSLVVPVTTFIASENDVSYLLTTSATEPGVNNANWSKTKPANYTFGSAGEKTLYAWVKDDAGNISASRNDTVTITIIPAVNGVCGADNNTCDSGSYADINDSANQSRWSCNGSNGGVDVSCFLSKPTVVSVTSNKPDGKYRAGTDMNIRVTFSEAVAVSGTPTLKLETGTNDAVISYDRIAENDAKTLIFQYTVAAGHDSRDLNYAGINALVLPGANSTIKSIKNVPADLTLPALDSTASLAGSKAIEIDTAGPVAPARPHVPDQRDVKIFGTSSSTTEPTIVTSGNTIRIRVKDCPAGHKVHIRDGALSSPIETKDCVVAGDVDFTLYTLSPSAKYNLYASFTDAAGNESALSPKQTIIKLALYSVTYVYADSTGGSIPPAQGKIHGTELTLARNVNNLAKDGYSFAGWSTATDGSGTNYAEGGAYALNASLVLYPRWTPIAATYLIRYNANSPTTGTAPADQTKTHDISLTLAAKPSNLEKTGYRFIGWNTLANGSGTKYTAGGAYTSNTATTLFAEWDPNSNKVTFDKNSTTATETMGDQLIETGETTKLNVNQFKNNGFIFAGWNTAANGSGTRYDDRADYTMGTANVRLYAQWTARTAITAIGDIAGTAQVGYTLTAGAVTPAGATVSYQWQRTNAEGDFINIDGETSNTYRIVAGAGDVGKRIRVSVTGTGLYKGTINSDPTVAVIGGPVNGTCGTAVDVYGVNDTSYGTRTFCGLSGSVPTPTNPSFPAAGASITWTCSGINGGNPSGTCTATKNTTALVSITAITGTKKVGSILTAGDINPAGATAGATYQWERAGADGVYTDIGLNSRTYTLVDADKDKFIRVSATGTGNYSGTVTSAATTAITGATVNGTCGTAASAYDSSATSYGASPVFCATGTPPSPAPSFPVVGTPVTWTCAGQNGGASVTTCTATKSKIGLQSVAINGNARVGSALTVSNLLPTGATATYQWKISSTANGTYSNIGTGNAYTPVAGDLNRFIRVSATGTGNYGSTVDSDPTAAITPADSTNPVNGACGATAPTCTAGTLNQQPVDTATQYLWTCEGTNGGTDASCSLPITTTPVNGVCGTTNNICTAGDSVDVTDSATQHLWSCNGRNGGTNASCTLAINTPPTVVTVTSPKANGSYRAAEVIDIHVEFSVPVTVVGVPTLTLETGTPDTAVSYVSTLVDGKTLVFRYTVAAGHNSSDLNYVNTTSLALPTGATIKATSAPNTDATLTLPALTGTTSLGGSKALVIDTTAPAAPLVIVVPTQANITAGITPGSYVATSTSMVANVACSAGERVRIYQALATTHAVQADCVNNLATLTLPLPSVAGSYTYLARLVDAAGNESANSPTISVIINPAPNPAPGVPDLNAISDLGTLSTDNITSEARPGFTLSCATGATVNLYDGTNTTAIGTGSCLANTVQIVPTQPLSDGVHSITAKQIVSGTTSAASAALSVTIDTVALNVTLAKATGQADSTTSSSISFTAAFSRPIHVASFICDDVIVTRGTCSSIVPLSGNTYTINVTANSAGSVGVNIIAGKVQTDSGVLNTESTGTASVTYQTSSGGGGGGGGGGGPGQVTSASCNTDLRRFTTSNPRSSSLDDEDLCNRGNPTAVSYSTTRKEWTYKCTGNDNRSVSCKVSAILDAAPECEAQELPFDSCRLTNTSNIYYFYEYLDCLGVAEKSSCNKTYGCPQEAKRQELVYIAAQLRGITLGDTRYDCQNSYSDTSRGVASWVCEAAEKAQTAGLISATNTKFRPTDTMTRSEAYSVLMKSICVHPETDYRNWQTKVAEEARRLGFTVRTVSTFEPNKLILKQELYALAARIAEYKNKKGDTCDDLPDELVCR